MNDQVESVETEVPAQPAIESESSAALQQILIALLTEQPLGKLHPLFQS